MQFSRSTLRYAVVVATVAVFTLAGFVVVEALGVGMLTAPSDLLRHGGVVAALTGAALLLADVLIPVPSSIIMVSFGALFGFLPAVLLSWACGTGATMLGFWIGRRWSRGSMRPPARVERLLARWGVIALVATRPLPILAETVAVMTGTSTRLGWRRVLAGAVVGSLPAALLYSAAGAYADGTVSGLAVPVAVVLLTVVVWAGERRWLRSGRHADA